MRIGIFIHGMGSVDFDVYVNHLTLMASLPKEYEYVFLHIRNTKVAQARNELVDLALEKQVDKLLVLDTDHILPTDILQKLLAVDTDVISGLICKRRPPYEQVGYVIQKDGKFGKVLIPLDSGVYDVDTCAFGCTLIDTKIFKELPKPYFYDGGEKNLRSDINFCLDVKKLGKKVKIHSGVLCGHVISEPEVVFPYNNTKINLLHKSKQKG